MTMRDARKGTTPPRSVEEALGRARRHALAALAESADAARALVDAAALAATGTSSEAHEWLARATQWLDAASAQAREGSGAPLAPWLDAVSEALDDEIERWEAKSRQDPEARSVLRAFLGVREILWEFGLRTRREAATPPADAPSTERATETRADAASQSAAHRSRPPRSARRAPTRLERVPVEG
jgi:hypothetical protein